MENIKEFEIQTSNNINIHGCTNPHTHGFCLAFYVKAGCLYESDEENGITHFMEHIIFRNINYLMNGELYQRLDRMGLEFNGTTYKEFVRFTLEGASAHFLDGLELFMKIFEKIELPASEIKIEQQRVKAEIREADDFKSLEYFASQKIWEGTSLKNTILGPTRNINRFNKKFIQNYQRKMFQPENCFFYVTGNVKNDELCALRHIVEQNKLPEKTAEFIRGDNCAMVPQDFGKRDGKIAVKNSPYTLVQFSFDVEVTRFSNVELNLLYDILFSGDCCIMQQELSEKTGMIYSFTCSMEKYRNIGRTYFTYEVRKNDIVSSIEIICQNLAKLKRSCKGHLQYVLPSYVDNAYLVYDDNEDFNWDMAYLNHILQVPEKTIEESIHAYSHVTENDLCNVANEIFCKENLVISVKGKNGSWVEIAEEIVKKYL